MMDRMLCVTEESCWNPSVSEQISRQQWSALCRHCHCVCVWASMKCSFSPQTGHEKDKGKERLLKERRKARDRWHRWTLENKHTCNRRKPKRGTLNEDQWTAEVALWAELWGTRRRRNLTEETDEKNCHKQPIYFTDKKDSENNLDWSSLHPLLFLIPLFSMVLMPS